MFYLVEKLQYTVQFDSYEIADQNRQTTLLKEGQRYKQNCDVSQFPFIQTSRKSKRVSHMLHAYILLVM